MKTLNNLLHATDFEAVFICLSQHYGEDHRLRYQELYQELLELSPGENDNNLTVSIRAFRPEDDDLESWGEPVYLENFTEEEEGLCFEVSGRGDDFDGYCCLSGAEPEEYLAYFVDKETAKKFSPESILAHVLWEMNWYNFENS
ncbi:MAG: hypothetical protein FWF85_06425 [Clostridiales bacterium]|jgi:hypothetical protein|nr:hypothetical protein [Clostridiales bacterium]